MVALGFGLRAHQDEIHMLSGEPPHLLRGRHIVTPTSPYLKSPELGGHSQFSSGAVQHPLVDPIVSSICLAFVVEIVRPRNALSLPHVPLCREGACACACACACAYARACVCVLMRVRVCACACACVGARTCARARACVRVSMCTSP